MEQRSDEWFLARLGVFTAGSTFKTIMHGTAKGKESLLLDKAAEILTQTWHEASASAMEWGKAHEPQAIKTYEFFYDVKVQETGLIYHPKSQYVGCSPDGLVDEDGGVEAKCPQTSREHVRRFLYGLPRDYTPQVQGCLWITDRDWWDFISYDPRMPEPSRFSCHRIEREEAYIAELEEKTWSMVEQLHDIIDQLMNRHDLDLLDGDFGVRAQGGEG